jgi:hypothetical protein
MTDTINEHHELDDQRIIRIPMEHPNGLTEKELAERFYAIEGMDRENTRLALAGIVGIVHLAQNHADPEVRSLAFELAKRI